MSRTRWDDIPRFEQEAWEKYALARFHAAGHSYAEECPEADRLHSIAQNGKWAWEREQRNWIERWSDGWYGMTWRNHWSMFRNNYIGHRNMCTYVGGPKFYIPPRRGPWLRFLRWLQVVPPRRMTVRDRVTILNEEPFD